jgi:hypothetical protein
MTIDKEVHHILEQHYEARLDDRILYQFYLIYKYGSSFVDNRVSLAIIAKAPNMDTLGRVRRRLQSAGLFQADKETKKMRKDRELEHSA